MYKYAIIRLIDMKKIVSVLVSLLLVEVSFSQQQGFFKIFEDQTKSQLVETAIEANEGGFFFTQYDASFNSKCDIVKLSEDGNILKRVEIDLFPSATYTCSHITGIYHDIQNPDMYLAIGMNIDVPNMFARPFVIHFDEDLNITFTREIDLPEQYRALETSACQMTHDGKFIFVSEVIDQQKRLYMLISPDGDLDKLHEDSQDAGLYIGTLFEYPEGNRYGHYRQSFFRPPNPLVTTRLFTLDENFDTIASKEFTAVVYDTIGNEIYRFSLDPIELPTVKVLGDTALLFCDRIRETRFAGTQSHQEKSTLLFKTDLSGNILDYHILGSWNNYNDLPALGQAFDFTRDPLTSQRQLYVFCERYDIDDAYYSGPNSVILTKMDEDGNVVWQNSYSLPSALMKARYVLATRDGGCFVMGDCKKNSEYDVFAIKVDSEGSVGIDEVSPRPFTYYPNPTRNELHLKHSPDVQPVQVELYDLQGRLVHTQRSNFEHIDMSQLPAGTYTMRVTWEDGKAYSDKVVKE